MGDKPKCEIGHSNFVYCSALWCSLVILGNWGLDLNDAEILVQINLCQTTFASSNFCV